MGMFETTGRADAETPRSANTLKKVERIHKALRHEEPDRVPIGDFFWGAFIRRWRKELELADDTASERFDRAQVRWVSRRDAASIRHRRNSRGRVRRPRGLAAADESLLAPHHLRSLAA